MFGSPPIAMEFAVLVLFGMALWRGVQMLMSLRRQWTIADWLFVTFWIGLVLSMFANR